MRAVLLGAAALVVLLYVPNLASIVLLLVQPTSHAKLCQIYDALAPHSFYADNSTVLTILEDETFRLESVRKLAAAVQVDTQVGDNQPPVDDAPEVWLKFGAFHQYLQETFPEVYAVAEVHTVNTWNIVYYWKGSDESLAPLMLTAHQDVVPVQKDTLKDWTYPPFAGHYDGTFVYGRGASDCKNLLVAVMEALQILAKEGFRPKRGVVAAFGFDEEASGIHGASTLSKFLLEKFGENGVYAIVDEGPGLMKDPLAGNIIASPATGEKGYVDLQVELQMPGGHSSMPPDHGAVGIVGELAYMIEQDQYEAYLGPDNPLLQFLQCVAVTAGDKMGKLQKKAILRAGFDKLANSKVVAALQKSPLTKYLIQTLQAADVVKGGEKANALPELVAMVVNHRIALGSSVEDVKQHFASRVETLAEKYDLSLVSYGEKVLSGEKGTFYVRVFSTPLESAPISPAKGKEWEVLAGTTRHVFEHLVLKNSTDYPIVTAPCLMPMNTDTRYYWALTKNIYRYTPMLVDYQESNIHSVDEKIRFEGHLQLLAWYYEYVQNVQPR